MSKKQSNPPPPNIPNKPTPPPPPPRKKTNKDLCKNNIANPSVDALELAKWMYRKHYMDDPNIGWEELGARVTDFICNTIGNHEFCEWLENTRKAMESDSIPTPSKPINRFKWWKCRGCKKEWDREDLINDHSALYCPDCGSLQEFKGNPKEFVLYENYRNMVMEKIKYENYRSMVMEKIKKESV